MKQEVYQTSLKDIDSAIAEITSKLAKSPSQYDAVIFFASADYDFPKLASKIKNVFSKAEVIGTSTSGEISESGFKKRSLVVSAVSCNKTRFSGLIIDNVDKFPIIDKSKIEAAAAKCGIAINSAASHKDAFALTFINGLCNAEEALLALFYAIIKNDQFLIAGGSAGDDLQFKKTYVSYNGETVSNGAVILFVKTQCPFDIRKENIFKPSGKRVTITKADVNTRTIYEIDGRNAGKYYSECIGVPQSEVQNAILDHPFGRVFGGKIFISSLASFTPTGAINMYSRVLPNTTVEILNLDDSLQIATDNLTAISKTIPRPGFVFVINCILRTIGFERRNLCGKMTDLYKKVFPVFCGFSSYGEQIGKINPNQTFVSIVIGE
ncbi:hypothetical protein FUT79_03225 [Treponema phagedenis]|uniref:FIST signal transduction protein n=2 Tax=Treponema phagedenis TaxID=162 RepID=UPI0004672307|nr:FIST N-terminal domain-containing protein [Treponema phagedenis]QEJ94312.1 hypothetical protein FUT79_03225 [Treponema phagedenis]